MDAAIKHDIGYMVIWYTENQTLNIPPTPQIKKTNNNKRKRQNTTSNIYQGGNLGWKK
jgi:hypothetical protein